MFRRAFLIIFLLQCGICRQSELIRPKFVFPEYSGPESEPCSTAGGSPGFCEDIHLCPSALKDIAEKSLYPRVCHFNAESKVISVCCPKNDDVDEDECGIAFPLRNGFESALDEEEAEMQERGGNSKVAILRRPPEQEALFLLAKRHFDNYRVCRI